MCRKANYPLHTFSCCDPFVKTHIFSSFSLSLYEAALWKLSLEVSYNNILWKIWSLPCHSHTGIVLSIAGLQSIYNTVVYCSRRLLASAKRSTSALISGLFDECGQSAFTFVGYNNLFGDNHLKIYTEDDKLCAAFIGDARSNPSLNQHLECDISTI